ncbi:hypothetical protein CCACVL1_15055, partial [Corchorus capsularis]
VVLRRRGAGSFCNVFVPRLIVGAVPLLQLLVLPFPPTLVNLNL